MTATELQEMVGKLDKIRTGLNMSIALTRSSDSLVNGWLTLAADSAMELREIIDRKLSVMGEGE